ncbi:hypothetical protein AMATHDRAFT_140364 [Amanita thiersii Skay4041]|uniref:Rsm22-domain-containing protein n=1 Tax=Amanita thiersii Skay4041 TaxID=703135 RepID=A0A2A9NQC9_9AGAR|nr:hypothetical protein AMATHDRAFT_140364 [Amanita thiersii Skay4041]
MLLPRSPTFRLPLSRRWNASHFSSCHVLSTRHPNPPLNLDPSLQALLKDVDMSILNYKSRPPAHRELELDSPSPEQDFSSMTSLDSLEEVHTNLGRKSPAAEFGSQNFGAIVLPSPLVRAVNTLIQDSNKALLHVDAKRLFLNPEEGKNNWDTQYDVRYKSRTHASRQSERDGMAFASVALPAHYSAIVAVLDHVKRRLGPSWFIREVIDWGAGAGSGLWASVCSFQQHPEGQIEPPEESDLTKSTISSYTGVEKRDGLVSTAKRLVQSVDFGPLNIRWQRSFKQHDNVDMTDHRHTLALSAFLLSSLSTALARRTVIKEMWESGADVMVIIDHKTPSGFKAIADAREYLLSLGQKGAQAALEEVNNSSIATGSHVIAPCPHDRACPLYYATSRNLTCGFSQRIQRPEFVRRTKHSKVGHEDVQYSYVVIRRGFRPPVATTEFGRIGEVGLRALQKTAIEQAPIKELTLLDGSEAPVEAEIDSDPLSTIPSPTAREESINGEALEAALRKEAYSWPRLIFPPLKRSGHIILDGCTAQGKILRMTIPKSQGKQPFYDARKSAWGDIFPHAPKKPGQERILGKRQADTNERDGEQSYPKAGKGVASHGETSKARHLERKQSRQHKLKGNLTGIE